MMETDFFVPGGERNSFSVRRILFLNKPRLPYDEAGKLCSHAEQSSFVIRTHCHSLYIIGRNPFLLLLKESFSCSGINMTKPKISIPEG